MNKLLYYSSSKTQNHVELYKDPGEIPHHFNKLFGYNAIIDDYYDSDYNYDKFHNVTLLKPFSHIKFINSTLKLLRLFVYAHKIDILYLLQITPDSMYKMLAYRLGGGRGKIYLKLDLGIYSKGGKDLLKWNNMSPFLKVVHFLFKPLPDIYTVETEKAYNRLTESYYSDLAGKKLFLLPNGIDHNHLKELGVVRRPLPSKEKIIMTVGRIGDYLKNTELLLDILERVTLDDWNVYIVGPIDSLFSPKIDAFYNRNPQLIGKVLFTGNISDKKTLYELYNKSRIFIFTSRYESYAFSLVEAAYMNNFILTTPVGIAPELVNDKNGVIINNGTSHAFSEELQRLIKLPDYELNKLVSNNLDMFEFTWENILQNNRAIKYLLSSEDKNE